MPKIYHKAKLVDGAGNVSLLCAKTPRKIDLSKELWATSDDAVTCKKCLKLLNHETLTGAEDGKEGG